MKLAVIASLLSAAAAFAPAKQTTTSSALGAFKVRPTARRVRSFRLLPTLSLIYFSFDPHRMKSALKSRLDTLIHWE